MDFYQLGFLPPQFLGLWDGANDAHLPGLGRCLCSIKPVSLPEYPCLHLQDKDKTGYLWACEDCMWHSKKNTLHSAGYISDSQSMAGLFLAAVYHGSLWMAGMCFVLPAGTLEGAARCPALLLVAKQMRVIVTVGGAPLY